MGVRLPHIIVALLAALASEARDDLDDTRPAKKLVDRLAGMARNVSRDIAKGLDKLSGIPILTAALRASQEFSARFRDQAVTQIQDLLRDLNDLMTEVANDLKTDIVFIIDNLEKIPEQSTDEDTNRSLHEALFVRDLPLLDIPAHLVLTYPISLNYSNVELLRVYPGSGKTTLPMVSVRQPPGTPQRGDESAGIAALRHLLSRRVAEEVFASIEVIEHLIRLSGGCIRDLMRFVHELPVVGDPPYTREHVDLTVQDFRNDYEKILLGKPYVRHLRAIEETGLVSDALEPERHPVTTRFATRTPGMRSNAA